MTDLDTAIDNVRRTKSEAAKHPDLTIEAQLARCAYFAALDDLVVTAQLVRESERKASRS